MDDNLDYGKTKIIKVISGGQTGADQGGLQGAYRCKVETGGTAPKGYKTENGMYTELIHIYKLKEHSSSDYPPRTKCNVLDSDVTILVGNMHGVGTKLTRNLCRANCKPYIEVPDLDNYDIDLIVESLQDMGEIIVNVAGNRESKNPGIQMKTADFIEELITNINKD